MKYECTHCTLNESAAVMAAAASQRKITFFCLEFGLSCSYLHIAGGR
jgi:hypothetical protein